MRSTSACPVVCFVGLAVSLTACASATGAPDRVQLSEAIQSRTGQGIPTTSDAPAIPPGVSLEDGLTEPEAVATALWNSPSFQTTLADLGVARAELIDAGLLRNPILSLLFPVGPKQLEWTLQFPVEALWQRPRRVAAARLNAQSVGERLVHEALRLVADVRRAHVDAIAADRRLALAGENAQVMKRIRNITEARLREGDISELEARSARNDAAQADALLQALTHDRDASTLALLLMMGIDRPTTPLTLTARTERIAGGCGSAPALIEAALASRPDVRAAEIAVEAAGQRLRWERSRVVNLIAALDANGQGREGFELGPGVGGDLPIFSQNQGAISRADAELERASRNYVAVRLRVSGEIRTALVRFNQGREALNVWAQEIVPSLETEQGQAERAYQAGELALISLLDVSRRLIDARLRSLDATASFERAAVTLDQSVGRACTVS